MISACVKTDQGLPENFVFLSDIDNTIIENVRYYTNENFLGKQVAGYKVDKIICTKEAAVALKKANDYFKSQGYKLVVYDGYRPQRAVDEFRKWGFDAKDIATKSYYYPTLAKKSLFNLGYIAGENSSHSRGSTFDLTLIKINSNIKPITYSIRTLKNGEKIPFLDDNTVDMGSSFDLFHKVSHHNSLLIGTPYAEMRDFLKQGLKRFGFKEINEEWWHYTLDAEPYPNTYFDFIGCC